MEKERPDKELAKFDYRGFSREKSKFHRASTSMSMRGMEPIANPNETYLI